MRFFSALIFAGLLLFAGHDRSPDLSLFPVVRSASEYGRLFPQTTDDFRVMHPTQAWDHYYKPYSDYETPTESQLEIFMFQHDEFLSRVKTEFSMD